MLILRLQQKFIYEKNTFFIIILIINRPKKIKLQFFLYLASIINLVVHFV